MQQLGFGGGCHWCTEAVFQSLQHVVAVRQGWLRSDPPHDDFSEGVVVEYEEGIDIRMLVEIHLLTHSSTSDHSLRHKYRSAIYFFHEAQESELTEAIESLTLLHQAKYITLLLRYRHFRSNSERFLRYYERNKTAPFCETYISPKLALIRERFASKARMNF